jgi:hypothetical protein
MQRISPRRVAREGAADVAEELQSEEEADL